MIQSLQFLGHHEWFLWLSLGSNQYQAERVYVCILWGEHSKTQPKVFLEKPGIEPAPPGLQGIVLIHYYTTGPSWMLGTCYYSVWQLEAFTWIIISIFQKIKYNVFEFKTKILLCTEYASFCHKRQLSSAANNNENLGAL